MQVQPSMNETMEEDIGDHASIIVETTMADNNTNITTTLSHPLNSTMMIMNTSDTYPSNTPKIEDAIKCIQAEKIFALSTHPSQHS